MFGAERPLDVVLAACLPFSQTATRSARALAASVRLADRLGTSRAPCAGAVAYAAALVARRAIGREGEAPAALHHLATRIGW